MHVLAGTLPVRTAAAPPARSRPRASRLRPLAASPGDELNALSEELRVRADSFQQRTAAAFQELSASPSPEALLGTLTRGEAELRAELGELQAAVAKRVAQGGAEPLAAAPSAAPAAPPIAAAEGAAPQPKLLANAVDELRAEIASTRRVLGL